MHHSPSQHIFMALYGRKPCGLGRGYGFAVSQPCDLQPGSVVVQKRRTGSEERKSDSLDAAWSPVDLCRSSLSARDRDVVHPLLAGFTVYAGSFTHSLG